MDPKINDEYIIKISKDEQIAINEKRILEQINHPNIISQRTSIRNAPILHENQIILEYARKGTLFDLVQKFKKFPIEVVRSLGLITLDALNYLHSVKVYHLDLKLENIFVFDNFNLKLGDFGLSQISETGIFETYNTADHYTPPEVLKRQQYLGKSADLFSLGVMIWILFIGKPPFFKGARRDDENYHKYQKDPDAFFDMEERRSQMEIPNDFRVLIKSLFKENSAERPTIDELINDFDFFKLTQKSLQCFSSEVAGSSP